MPEINVSSVAPSPDPATSDSQVIAVAVESGSTITEDTLSQAREVPVAKGRRELVEPSGKASAPPLHVSSPPRSEVTALKGGTALASAPIDEACVAASLQTRRSSSSSACIRLFVGGLPPEADDEDMERHFSQYGKVLEATVMKDRTTGRSRNFGFVMLAASDHQDEVFQATHEVKGKRVTVRLHQDMESTMVHSMPSQTPTPTDLEVRKVFVGRLEDHFTIDLLKQQFSERFGNVVDVFLGKGSTGNSKRFGFITFESGDSARAALEAQSIDIDGISVSIKDATPLRQPGAAGMLPHAYGGFCPGAPGFGVAGYGAYPAFGQPTMAYGGFPPPVYCLGGYMPASYCFAGPYGAYGGSGMPGYPAGYPAAYGYAASSQSTYGPSPKQANAAAHASAQPY